MYMTSTAHDMTIPSCSHEKTTGSHARRPTARQDSRAPGLLATGS